MLIFSDPAPTASTRLEQRSRPTSWLSRLMSPWVLRRPRRSTQPELLVVQITGAVKEYNSKAASGNTGQSGPPWRLVFLADAADAPVTRVFCGNCGSAFAHKVCLMQEYLATAPDCFILQQSQAFGDASTSAPGRQLSRL